MYHRSLQALIVPLLKGFGGTYSTIATIRRPGRNYLCGRRECSTARTIATINAFQPAAETLGGAFSALAPLRYRGHPLALGGGSSSPIINRSRPPPGHAPPAGPSIAVAAALPHFPRVSECLGRSIAAASPSGSRSFLRRLAPQPRRAIVSAGAHVCALLAACGRLCAAGRGALPPSVGASALPLARR